MDAMMGGILGAVSASTVGATASYFTAHVQTRRYRSQNKLDESNAAKAIEEAAAGAVNLIKASAQTAVSDAEKRLTAIHDELVATRSELAEARKELHAAILELNHRDDLIVQLRGEVERLRARVVELEAKVGGRRERDQAGPALA